ncbi:hypothetical protein PENTCL1PPCAC_20072, partial [Pristionchus entomophagus]
RVGRPFRRTFSSASSSSSSPSSLSVSVIKRIRKELGLIKSLTRYGHSVRMANRAPRIAFCQFHLDKGTMFTAHCFTDESMVQVNSKGRFVFVRRGDAYRRVLPRHKHPACLMIWGGISWNGATPLVIIRRGTKVDGGVYQTMIHKVYLDWAERKYGGKVLLVQDNAPNLILRMQSQMKKVVEAQGAPVYD